MNIAEGELVKLAMAVEQEGKRLADLVRAGKLSRARLEEIANATNDYEPLFALRLLDCDI